MVAVFMEPVCGVRSEKGVTERTKAATAPIAAARPASVRLISDPAPYDVNGASPDVPSLLCVSTT